VEYDIGAHTGDDVLIKGPLHPGYGLFSVFAVGHQLGYQRVVVRRYDISGVDTAVHPDPRPPRTAVAFDLAWRGGEVVEGVLSIDPALNGPAVDLHVALVVCQGTAGSHYNLLFGQVHSGDHLGDGMLHLQAGVHLQEVEVAPGVHELHCTGAGIAYGLGRFDRNGSHLLSQILAHHRGGRFLNQLLVAALDGAFPVRDIDGLAVIVGQDLKLDVPGLGEILLNVDGVVSKGAPGHGLRGGEGGHQLLFALNYLHAYAAPSCRRLEDDGVAYGVGDLGGYVRIADALLDAGDNRHSGVLHGLAGGDLGAHGIYGRGWGADEDYAVLLAGGGKAGVLG